jgi:hypothetical protein
MVLGLGKILGLGSGGESTSTSVTVSIIKYFEKFFQLNVVLMYILVATLGE